MNTLAHDNTRYPAWIETGRLLLRPPRLEDATEISALAEADEAFAHATVGDEANSLEGACTAIVRMLEDRRLALGAWWVAEEKANRRIVGLAGYSSRNATGGLVYALAAEHSGKGYVFEALEALSMSGGARIETRLDTLSHDHRTDAAATPHLAHARWYWKTKSNDAKGKRAARCA